MSKERLRARSRGLRQRGHREERRRSSRSSRRKIIEVCKGAVVQ
jgi:hypothetical protein